MYVYCHSNTAQINFSCACNNIQYKCSLYTIRDTMYVYCHGNTAQISFSCACNNIQCKCSLYTMYVYYHCNTAHIIARFLHLIVIHCRYMINCLILASGVCVGGGEGVYRGWVLIRWGQVKMMGWGGYYIWLYGRWWNVWKRRAHRNFEKVQLSISAKYKWFTECLVLHFSQIFNNDAWYVLLNFNFHC